MHLDLDGLLEDGAREDLDLARERRGEEDGLAVGPDLRDDARDLRLEAHVEHAVGLVDDEERDAAQVSHHAVTRHEDVDHAARRADDDLDAALELVDLVLDLRAAVGGAACEAQRLGEETDLAADLRGTSRRVCGTPRGSASFASAGWLLRATPSAGGGVRRGGAPAARARASAR